MLTLILRTAANRSVVINHSPRHNTPREPRRSLVHVQANVDLNTAPTTETYERVQVSMQPQNACCSGAHSRETAQTWRNHSLSPSHKETHHQFGHAALMPLHLTTFTHGLSRQHQIEEVKEVPRCHARVRVVCVKLSDNSRASVLTFC
eukprot:6491461-Amphidinium_carterae.1